MKNIKIAVLDYGAASVDIINVDADFININYHDDIELFLSSWCDYDIDNINWIADEKLRTFPDLTLDNFAGDDDIKSNNTKEDETY